MMMTTIQVVQHLRPGGIETMVLDFMKFAGPDEKVIIVSLEGTKDVALQQWPRLQQHRDNLIFLDKPAGWRLDSFKQLYKLFKSLRPQTVHTHHIGPLLYAGISARLAGVQHLIHTEHDAWHLQDSKRRRLQSLVLRLAKPRLVADALTVAENIQRFLPGIQSNIIYNGIDCERFVPGDKQQARKHFALDETATYIGCAGRMEEVKGQIVLIEAMPWIAGQIKLVLAGSGSREKALKERVTELGLEHRVTFLGHIDDMIQFYQSIDVFCLPSFNEGLPLSLLEAQACNVPVVATDVGGVAEAIDPASGKLVPAGDSEAMAIMLQKLLSESVKSPRDFVLSFADVRQMISGYKQLLKESI